MYLKVHISNLYAPNSTITKSRFNVSKAIDRSMKIVSYLFAHKELLKNHNSSTNSRVVISNQHFKQAFLCQECSFKHIFQLPKNDSKND